MRILNYVASVSGGKDSIAMFELILERGLPLDAVIFFDTGMEFPSIYRNMNRIKRKCIIRGILFIQLTPHKSFLYQMLKKPITGRKNPDHIGKGWCGGPCRWGTTQKTQAIHKWVKWKWVHQYIGIASDEPKRVREGENKLYPLLEMGMSEEDCLAYCRKKGYNWREGDYDLYDLLDRVSCWCCRNKNLRELKNYYYYLPHYWARLKALEARIGKPMKQRYTLEELEERFSREGDPQVVPRYRGVK